MRATRATYTWISDVKMENHNNPILYVICAIFAVKIQILNKFLFEFSRQKYFWFCLIHFLNKNGMKIIVIKWDILSHFPTLWNHEDSAESLMVKEMNFQSGFKNSDRRISKGKEQRIFVHISNEEIPAETRQFGWCSHFYFSICNVQHTQ